MTYLEGLSSAGLFGEMRRAVRNFREGRCVADAIERIRMIRREVARRKAA